MVVSIIDVIIILMIAMGAIVGFKNGAIKEGTKFIGLFAIIIISFILKDKLMVLLYENMPFFDFFGVIKGIDAINVLFYQLISFLVIFTVFMFVLKVLLVVTGLVEWLLKMTIFLSIPSKILGIFVGMLEYYVYLFIILYILNMPIFGLTLVSESKVGSYMLDNTPILSDLVDDTVKAYSDVWDVVKNRDDLSNMEANTYVLATLLDNKLITIESARKLVKSNYITIEDTSILDKYKDDESFFEAIGGCVLIGGCNGENNAIKEVYKTNIYTDGDTYSYENISFKVSYIGFNSCISDSTCKEDDKIEVGLTVNTIFSIKEMKVTTGDRYKWIADTDNYIFARIEKGSLVVGIAEYDGRWNIYDN